MLLYMARVPTFASIAGLGGDALFISWAWYSAEMRDPNVIRSILWPPPNLLYACFLS